MEVGDDREMGDWVSGGGVGVVGVGVEGGGAVDRDWTC